MTIFEEQKEGEKMKYHKCRGQFVQTFKRIKFRKPSFIFCLTKFKL